MVQFHNDANQLCSLKKQTILLLQNCQKNPVFQAECIKALSSYRQASSSLIVDFAFNLLKEIIFKERILVFGLVIRFFVMYGCKETGTNSHLITNENSPHFIDVKLQETKTFARCWTVISDVTVTSLKGKYQKCCVLYLFKSPLLS